MRRRIANGLYACVGSLLLCACGRLGFTELPVKKTTHVAGAGAGASATVPDSGPADAASQDAANAMQDAAADAMLSDASPDAAAADGGGTMPTLANPCANSTLTNYCDELPPLAAAPVLDGVLDCGPPLIDLDPRGWVATSGMAEPTDVKARIAVAWRPNGVYAYVEVDDPNVLPSILTQPWCGDGVELYVDSDGRFGTATKYDDPGTIQLLARAPTASSVPTLLVDDRYRSTNSALVGTWSATSHVMRLRPGGYALEAFVAAQDLDLTSLTLHSGANIGLDIAIDVSVSSLPVTTGEADCGYRLGQYFMRVSTEPCTVEDCRPYVNTEAFCTPRLLE